MDSSSEMGDMRQERDYRLMEVQDTINSAYGLGFVLTGNDSWEECGCIGVNSVKIQVRFPRYEIGLLSTGRFDTW